MSAPTAPTGSPETGQIAARDGLKLFYRRWPVHAHRAVLVIAHGLGEHSGRYAHVAAHLNAQGIEVWALDHRGHGQSEGARGCVNDSADFLHDLDRFLLHVREKTGGKPFLLGHSLGGLIAASYATHNMGPLRGLALSSPALKLHLSAPQALLARVLSTLAPKLTVPNGLKRDKLSHDPAVAIAYSADPLVHDKASGPLVNWMVQEAEYVHAHAAALSIPVLMLWAGQDALVHPAGSERFFAALPATVRSGNPLPDLYHEIFNEREPDRSEALSVLSGWLSRHVYYDHG